MVMILNKKKFSCWNCNSFQYDDPENSRTGTCRKAAPCSPCARSEATFGGFDISVTNQGGPGASPRVQDGPLFWCLEWTLATHPLQPVPNYPD